MSHPYSGRLAALTAATPVGAIIPAVNPPTAQAATAATVNGSQGHQAIDGFGFSEAFGRAKTTPRYVWDHDDDSQVWLAQQAKTYGATRFYADAWSAPGYMKTNNDEANGGTLCGLSGASCASGDWRCAYANYLVQYAKFYAQEGITINDMSYTLPNTGVSTPPPAPPR